MIGVDHHFVARQMRWQRTVIAHRSPEARLGLPAAGSFGGVTRRLMLGNGLLLVLQAELQLIRRQLFGPATELVARKALDQQPQLVVLGQQLLQHLLQDRGIIRQVVSIARHNAMMNDRFASLPELVAPNSKILSGKRRSSYNRCPPLAAVEQCRQLG